MRKPVRYEGSPADNRADREGAKKAGVTMTKWERSAADKKADAAAQAKMRKKKR